MRFRSLTAAMIAAMALTLLGAPGSRAAAQSGAPDPRSLQLTREQLEQTLAEYERAATSPGYSSSLREQAEQEAALIRQRLEQGDFQVGDRIVLIVRGEQRLSDTLTVEPGPRVTPADIDPIPLAGVLRSELQPYLQEVIARYVRDPIVEARSLIRLGVMGQVGRQGFYVLPASMLLENAIMAAGGPAPNADLDELRIERGPDVVWEGAALADALVQGRTLDQLSLRAGDRIIVPEEGGFLAGLGVLRTILLTIPPLILLGVQVF